MSLKIFAELVDEQTKKQIEAIHAQKHYKKQKIRIMPDCHLGKGSCIGFTQELNSNLVNPAFVGVDIGCGVTMMIFKSDKQLDLAYLDKLIKNNIPHGMSRNKNSVRGFHSSWTNSHIRIFARNWLKHLTKLPCKKCGYSKHVELAHIRAVSDFRDDELLRDVNSADNIVQLCRNCHWEFDNLDRTNFFS